LRNPRVLLPVGAEHWTEDRIHAVVRHELAHVVRSDWGTAVVASVLRAIYWFNPLMWIAYGRLRQEAERACDDIVLASGISGADYATHLLGVARESALHRRFWSPAIAIADRSTLEGRVRAMLNARVNRAPLTGLTKASTAISLVIVTVFIGTVALSSHTEEPARADVYLSSSALPALDADPSKVPGDAPRPRSGTQATPSSGGTIEGVLYDQFGGLLPGVSVRLTQLGSGSVRTASTDRGGAFAFRGLAADDYELLTELPGFTTVKNVIRAESGGSVRRHITLPIGMLQETIHATCGSVGRLATPSAPTASTTPGGAKPAATSGAEPKIPATFTGGIGGQIRVPRKVTHVNPMCPSNATPASTVIRLAGRIGIDGLFSDLQNLSTSADPAYVASAMNAVRGWVFTPTLLNGAPIEVNISVTVSYSWSN
jgi:hypothetical protein